MDHDKEPPTYAADVEMAPPVEVTRSAWRPKVEEVLEGLESTIYSFSFCLVLALLGVAAWQVIKYPGCLSAARKMLCVFSAYALASLFIQFVLWSRDIRPSVIRWWLSYGFGTAAGAAAAAVIERYCEMRE